MPCMHTANIEIIDAEISITDFISGDFRIKFNAFFTNVIKKPKNAINAKIPLSTAISRYIL